jgi:hypothetical protein
MIARQRPPVAQKKGIGIVQQTKTQKRLEDEDISSGMVSNRSLSRSRGISISRSTGIQLDKIYDNKHFPPVSAKKNQDKSIENMEKSLSGCRSLKLVSLKSETSISDAAFELQNESKASVNEGKPLSPVAKLRFGV